MSIIEIIILSLLCFVLGIQCEKKRFCQIMSDFFDDEAKIRHDKVAQGKDNSFYDGIFYLNDYLRKYYK